MIRSLLGFRGNVAPSIVVSSADCHFCFPQTRATVMNARRRKVSTYCALHVHVRTCTVHVYMYLGYVSVTCKLHFSYTYTYTHTASVHVVTVLIAIELYNMFESLVRPLQDNDQWLVDNLLCLCSVYIIFPAHSPYWTSTCTLFPVRQEAQPQGHWKGLRITMHCDCIASSDSALQCTPWKYCTCTGLAIILCS